MKYKIIFPPPFQKHVLTLRIEGACREREKPRGGSFQSAMFEGHCRARMWREEQGIMGREAGFMDGHVNMVYSLREPHNTTHLLPHRR